MKHDFIRRKDKTGVYERPERLRAAALGISAAYARLESAFSRSLPSYKGQPFEIIKSAASVGFDHLAVKYVHGADDGAYLSNLSRWARESRDRIAKGALEIPEALKDLEDDLYLCPESVTAFQGGLGTVCEAIDGVVAASDSASASRRAFVVIRPPGHHCGEDSPCGFCFVNGVAVGAAHAYIDHNISRVVIFDIDLHHGNGTQEIATQINSETYRDRFERNGLRMFYGSIHDISSYPCEEGKEELVSDASKSLSGEEGQWLENIHLQTLTTESDFWHYYDTKYSKIFAKAEEFVSKTGGSDDGDIIVLMSCGFDASEHESPAMNRHGRKVPTSFYHRFTRDVCRFAEKHALGRVVSVMEGGYEDRAIVSGAMAHVCGLVDPGEEGLVDPQWWSLPNLLQLEKQTKKRKGRKSLNPFLDQWLQRSLEIRPLLIGYPETSHEVAIPQWKPSKPVSAPVTGASPPRKRGRPRKVASTGAVSPSPAPADAALSSSSSKGRKRLRSEHVDQPNKQARGDDYIPLLVSTSQPPSGPSHDISRATTRYKPIYSDGFLPAPVNDAGVFAFQHAYGHVSGSLTVDPGMLQWGIPGWPIHSHTSHPLPPSVAGKGPNQHRYTPIAPAQLPTPSSSSDVEMQDDSTPSPVKLVDLSRHWPKGLISPGALSAASGTAYKCHTHYEPLVHGWGVRSVKNGMDQHYCYVPNAYKNALRYLNYRVAQLACAVDTPFHLPRASSAQQKERLRSLRDIIQRALLYHHSVREAVFSEIRERWYGGRTPATAKPSEDWAIRLPTLDTWLLHEYVIGVTGRDQFDSRRLEAALRKYDPRLLAWTQWANTSERKKRYGFNYPPSEKDEAMNEEAGISYGPVVEGIPTKPDWLKVSVEKEIKAIREDPSASPLYDYIPWSVADPSQSAAALPSSVVSNTKAAS
ncbi:hypothetical protein NM688_g1881 [Phlebia brevispora]|uniref:Uncharacterized protein n=1 Tax=Phlebia brevispora TaxID=194682 RepID=A0ACC1TAI5_9APHY|nr:hypothetical protein NM688_g1881 [Phlebia brevispora]